MWNGFELTVLSFTWVLFSNFILIFLFLSAVTSLPAFLWKMCSLDTRWASDKIIWNEIWEALEHQQDIKRNTNLRNFFAVFWERFWEFFERFWGFLRVFFESFLRVFESFWELLRCFNSFWEFFWELFESFFGSFLRVFESFLKVSWELLRVLTNTVET